MIIFRNCFRQFSWHTFRRVADEASKAETALSGFVIFLGKIWSQLPSVDDS